MIFHFLFYSYPKIIVIKLVIVKMVFRKRATHGIWCIVLLPTILFSNYCKEPKNYGSSDKTMIMCSLSLSLLSLITYYKFVFPVASHQMWCGPRGEGIIKYTVKAIFHDLFERKLSSVVRTLRKTSSAISSNLHPSSMREARRMREYTTRVKKSSTSSSPFVQKLIPGEDRKRSLDRKVPGSGVEPVIENPVQRQVLSQRKKSSLVEIIKGTMISNATSPTHLLVPPDGELYLSYLESMTSQANKSFLTTCGIILTIFITVFEWMSPGEEFSIYLPLSICFGNLCFINFLPKVYRIFKYQFTFGEGCLITQSCIIFIISTVSDFVLFRTVKGTDKMIILLSSKSYLLSIILILYLPSIFPFPIKPRRKIIWFFLFSIGAVVVMNLWIWQMICVNPIEVLFQYLSYEISRIFLILLWINVLAVFILIKIKSSVMLVNNKISQGAGTFSSPNFWVYFLIITLYLFVLFMDVNILCFATTMSFGNILVISYLYRIRVSSTINDWFDDCSSNLSLVDNATSQEASEDYLDYLLDTQRKEENGSQNRQPSKKHDIPFLNVIYSVANLTWPVWLLAKKMDYAIYEEFICPSYVCVFSIVLILIGIEISSRCNEKMKDIRNFPDTEESVEGAAFSILAQVFFLWLIKKIAILGRAWMWIEHDYYAMISAISELNIMHICTSLTLIKSFCTQSHYLVLCPILYIITYLTL